MKNYIWDFDGMLFDSYPHITAAFLKMMADFGRQADYDKAKALLEVSFATCYEYYGVTEEMGERHHFYERQFDFMPPVVPFPNTYETLKAVCDKGGRNILYTHRGRETSRYYLEKYGMTGFFSFFTDSSDGFPSKPAPDAIEHICLTCGLDKRETVMTGDREIDVLAGKNAGIYSCLFTRGEAPKTIADYVIHDIKEILNF